MFAASSLNSNVATLAICYEQVVSNAIRVGKNRSYLIIAPCRDEATYLQRTVESIIAQTVQPKLFLIIDDGSTDATPEMLAAYEAKHDFIKVIRKKDRGGRSVGPGVIETFYFGWSNIDPNEFEYVTKLDLDLDLPPRYFETLIERMEQEPRIGTCSGKPYFPRAALAADAAWKATMAQGFRTRAEEDVRNAEGASREPRFAPAFEAAYGPLVSESCGDEMSVGMTKFYRRACFEAIGGFVREVMWDGIDCHRCRMLGWMACSWDDPELRFVHLRPMGSSQDGIMTGRMRHGFGQYFMGTGLSYITATALFRMTRPPYVLGGLGMWVGYVQAMMQRRSRYDDPEFRAFLRRYQRDCLLKGKARATNELDSRQRVAWQQG